MNYTATNSSGKTQVNGANSGYVYHLDSKQTNSVKYIYMANKYYSLKICYLFKKKIKNVWAFYVSKNHTLVPKDGAIVSMSHLNNLNQLSLAISL